MIREIYKTREEILPIAEQKPSGLPSESEKWYQHTFVEKEEIPLQKRVMVVMAHPDDEDFSGGTIAKLAQEGYSITLVTVTDGRLGMDPRLPMSSQKLVATRLEETYQSGQILGLHRMINLGVPDREVSSHPDVLSLLTQTMKENPASLYITHANPKDPKTQDYHEDHVGLAGLVTKAIQRSRDGNPEMHNVPTLLYADTQGARNDIGVVRKFGFSDRRWHIVPKASSVDILVDISRVVGQKLEAFSQHRSQITNLSEGVTDNYVVQSQKQAAFRARQVRRLSHPLRSFIGRWPEYAEGFSIHAGHGFNTDISGVFISKDIWLPKRIFTPHAAPLFTSLQEGSVSKTSLTKLKSPW